jgi:hypothetical protein
MAKCCRLRRYAPFLVHALVINQALWTILQIKNMVPEFMRTSDFKPEEDKITVAVIAMCGINFTSWRTSFFMNMLVVLPMLVYSQRLLIEVRFDPYSKEPQKDNSGFMNTKAVQAICILFFVTIGHYLKQRDLLVIKIQKFMI